MDALGSLVERVAKSGALMGSPRASFAGSLPWPLTCVVTLNGAMSSIQNPTVFLGATVAQLTSSNQGQIRCQNELQAA